MNTGGPVPMELQLETLSPLYRGFFSNPDFTTPLSEGLGACLGQRTVVRVTYDNERRIGHIIVDLEPEELGCKVVQGPDGLDVSALEPIGRALAVYRDQVSAHYDVRVASFRGEVRLRHRRDLCTLRIGGQYPPDGSQWHRCIELAGVEHCMPGDVHTGVTVLALPDKALQRSLISCFGL